jgi:transketolase
MLSSIPHVDVYCLTCSEEAESLMTQAIENFAATRMAGKIPHSTVFFLGRENFPKTFAAGATYQLGKAQIIRDEASSGKSVTILASGSCMVQAVHAGEQLKAMGIGSVIINPGMHNHLDTATIREALKKTGHRLIVVEDHQQIGGLAQMTAFSLAQQGIAFQLKSLAVKSEFGQSAYSAQELYRKHKIDAASIVEAASDWV